MELFDKRARREDREVGGGYTEIQSYLVESNPDRVSQRGWDYLANRGIYPGSQKSAYLHLSRLNDYAHQKDSKERVEKRLKAQLLDSENQRERHANRKKEVYRLLQELQTRRVMSKVRDQRGGS